MAEQISSGARQELIAALRHRYLVGTKTEKTRILDEFVKIAGCHRKHAIRLLRRRSSDTGFPVLADRRIYGEAIQQAVVVLWEASDRICAKRLKAAIPMLLQSIERHGHLARDVGRGDTATGTMRKSLREAVKR